MGIFFRKSNIAESGLFTDSPIRKGEKIFSMTGRKVSVFELHLRMAFGSVRYREDPHQIGRFWYILGDDSPDCYTAKINHSCDPTCGINVLEVFALRDVNAGEELTFDYSTSVSPDLYYWKMNCGCGTARCRKIVGSVDTLPPDVFDDYLRSGALPKWIQFQRGLINVPAFLDVFSKAILKLRGAKF